MKKKRKKASKKYVETIKNKEKNRIIEESFPLYISNDVYISTNIIKNDIVRISCLRMDNEPTCIDVDALQSRKIEKFLFILFSLCDQTDSFLEISKEEILYITSPTNETYIERLESFIKQKNIHMYDVLQIIKKLSYLDVSNLEFVKVWKETSPDIYFFALQSKILQRVGFIFHYDIKKKEVLKYEFHCMCGYYNNTVEIFNLYHLNFENISTHEGVIKNSKIEEMFYDIFQKHPGIRMNKLFLTE